MIDLALNVNGILYLAWDFMGVGNQEKCNIDLSFILH
jgi:hypothetical protein